MWNGGNQWSGYPAYLSYFRHVAQLNLPEYDAWKHYEAAAIRGGPRIMHEDFCMISDRPEFIHRDAQNRPHCETGPYCRWRDGWSLYYWHGVRVSRELIEEPGKIDVKKALRSANQEVRRATCERLGWERVLAAVKAREVQRDDYGVLLETRDLGDGDPTARFVRVKCPSTDREYVLRVPPATRSARAAVAWTFQVETEKYAPAVQT